MIFINSTILKKILLVLFFFLILINYSFSEIIKKIEISGNNRISSETIKVFADVKIDDDLDDQDLNIILKNVYESNFFDNVAITLDNTVLKINVSESPLIDSVKILGIKSKSLEEEIYKIIKLKSRSSFNKYILNQDINNISNNLKILGYYFSEITTDVINLSDNRIDLNFNIDLGNKAKIKKITFNGDKIFKDNKLKSIIVSEEYKFWKFISGKKYLNENLTNLDKRLLNNFYLNKGYYNVSINSSFAKLIKNNEFELIFNIDANEKVYFDNINLNLPVDFNKENFSKLYDIFLKMKDSPYSLTFIEKIINEIELLALSEQYESIQVSIEEKLIADKLSLEFNINETEKFYVNKINILGNNITNENVIRNQFFLDEGDPFNDILLSKTINNIKGLNFFKSVSYDVKENADNLTKSIDILVEEKATGEITAGAGFGTGGATLAFGVKENNFLGNGKSLDTSLTISDNAIRGKFEVVDPNYRNSDKSIFYNIQSLELDRLKGFGYKTNKSGFEMGTRFEYLQDLNLGLGIENYFEKITTDSTASTRQKAQSGSYWDSFVNVDLNFDKRNQKFQATSGYYSIYSSKLPVISDSSTFTSTYDFKIFEEFYENNVTTASFSVGFAKSLNNKDIKLSERLFISGRKLRGFESGKIGPKDGSDFIGGNYYSSFNITSSIPKILENNQNLDFAVFFDSASLWGVDYDPSLEDGNSIRSSIGIGVDWLTPVGPLSFSLAQPITKKNTDITETFRFNLGTTF